MTTDDTDLEAFFEAYARSFEAHDAEAIAACYATPCLFVRDGQTVAPGSGEAVLESVLALLALHRAWDVQTTEAAEVAVLERAPAHALVRVGWALGRSKSRLTWRYATTYALVPAADGWRIASALTHDAPF